MTNNIRKSSGLAFQGDIALLKIDALPDGAIKVMQALSSTDREAYGYHPEKGLVLAQGESRAHFHAFRETDRVEMFANDNRLFVVIKGGPATLFHEEHDPIEFQEGVHELIFQHEYTFEEEYRRVAD